jgi:hypothetical protein
MKRSVGKGIVLVSMAVTASLASAAWAAPPAPATDRLTFMASGVDWDRASDGGGGSIGWIHSFNANALVGLAGEYQRLGSDTHWSFGTLTLGYGHGQAERRSNYYLEVRGGGGDDATGSFTYSMVTAGLFQNLTHQLALQIEDKQIDINTSHGNLPKVGLQFLWSPRLLTIVSYAHSTNPTGLGTRLWTVRADYYGKQLNLIAGGATGQATPVVFNFQGLPIPGLQSREGYIGVTKPFSRMDLTLMADYLKLGDFKRKQLSLNGTVFLNGGPVR